MNKDYIETIIKNSSSLNKINNWKIDKFTTNNNRITKIEVYNYFLKKDLKKILKFLETKSFKYENNKNNFPRLWNIILKQEGKHIISKGKIINIEEKKYNFYYYVYLARVIKQRNRVILIKIYWNKSLNKSFFKLELTYSYHKKNYNIHKLEWLSSLKLINEIIRKIEKKIKPIGFKEDFSKKQDFIDFIYNDLIINKNIIKNYFKRFKSITNPNSNQYKKLLKKAKELKEFNNESKIINKLFINQVKNGNYDYLIKEGYIVNFDYETSISESYEKEINSIIQISKNE